MKTEESLRQGMKESLEAEGNTLPAGACSAFLYRAWMVLCLYRDQTGLCLYRGLEIPETLLGLYLYPGQMDPYLCRDQMVPYLSPDSENPGSPLLDPCLSPGQVGLWVEADTPAL